MSNEIKYAVSVCGIPNQNGDGDFYAKVGRNFLSSGILVSSIQVSPTGNGGMGYFDLVQIFGMKSHILTGEEKEPILLWEGSLAGLEGVNYVC